MRFAFALAVIASPVLSDEAEKPVLEMDCMEVIGPAAYGPKTYGAGVTNGIILGYVLARGGRLEDADRIGEMVGALCRQNPGYTFGDVLRAFDRD